MSENLGITGTTTVREVMTRYPQAEAIFASYGLTGCGGPRGPVEPIAFFATVHHVDPQVLLAELNELAARTSHEVPTTAAAPEVPAEPDIYRPFVKAAIGVVLTVGCSLGAVNLLAMALGGTVGTPWAAVTQAHGHAQIFGWVGLFIMGVAYHVLPRLKATELQGRSLALASFWLVLGGLAVRMFAQPLAAAPFFAWMVAATALAELVGASLFVFVALRTLASSTQPADFYEKYIVASASWFWVLAASTLALAVYMALAGLDTIPTALDLPYLHVALMGFVAMMIFGFALRTIPVFMGLRPPSRRAFDIIFWVLNLTVAVRALAWLALPSQGQAAAVVGAVGGVVEWTAVAAFVYYLNLFRRPESDVSEAGVTHGYEKYVRAAFLWLLVAATMAGAYAVYQAITGVAVAHSLVGAYRHAFTVGFISLMIIGMSARIIPVFTGVRLHSQALLLASFVLLNLGNTLRVLSQPLADFVGGPFFVTMGVSGFIEVTALALFGYNLWQTMEHPALEDDVPIAAGAITRDTVVADVLTRYPQSLGVFLEHGFDQLKNPIARRTLARAVTVEEATRIHPADLQRLLSDLNAARGLAPAASAPQYVRQQEKEMADHNSTITIDVRTMQPWERHPRIFELLDSLVVGQRLQLVNDHDPRPLRYQLMHEQPDQFDWESHEEAPRQWVATITRLAAAPHPQASLRTEVQAALDTVRPYLQADGGDVELVDVDEDGTVGVRLLGACGGCPMSQLTLANAVERALKEQVRAVKRVVPVAAAAEAGPARH